MSLASPQLSCTIPHIFYLSNLICTYTIRILMIISAHASLSHTAHIAQSVRQCATQHTTYEKMNEHSTQKKTQHRRRVTSSVNAAQHTECRLAHYPHFITSNKHCRCSLPGSYITRTSAPTHAAAPPLHVTATPSHNPRIRWHSGTSRRHHRVERRRRRGSRNPFFRVGAPGIGWLARRRDADAVGHAVCHRHKLEHTRARAGGWNGFIHNRALVLANTHCTSAHAYTYGNAHTSKTNPSLYAGYSTEKNTGRFRTAADKCPRDSGAPVPGLQINADTHVRACASCAPAA